MTLEEKLQEFDEIFPLRCEVCLKPGVNIFGECKCSYELSDKIIEKKKKLLDFIKSIHSSAVEETKKANREKLNKVYGMLNKQNSLMESLRKDKDLAYEERNKLVCALSKLFPAWLGKHEEIDESWGKEWMNIVYIQLPSGQVSWHIHEDLLPLFAHLEVDLLKKWDGHTTEEKYNRLSTLQTNKEVEKDN